MNPNFANNFYAIDEISYLRYQEMREKNAAKKRDLAAKIASTEKTIPPNFTEDFAEKKAKALTDPEFQKFIDKNCTRDWQNNDPLVRQLVNPEYSKKFFAKPKQNDCRTQAHLEETHMRALQNQRKKSELTMAQTRRAVLDQILQDPALHSIKDRYEAIRSCEASSLK